jgi:hypothetical protein
LTFVVCFIILRQWDYQGIQGGVMAKGMFLSKEFLPNFHDRERSLEKITDERNIVPKIWNQFILVNLLALLYGFIMGCYNGFYQALSSGIKMPVLFSLLIIVCFPAFYVIQSVLGSRLSLAQMVSIILAGFIYTTSIMVSFSTIVLFFMITGGNYAFIKLLHVAVIALAGIFGMKHIVDALTYSCEKKKIYPKTGITVFRFWIVILFFVGSQLSWSLRPFIGTKDTPFELFRKQEGNFYQAFFQSIIDLMNHHEKPSGR